ncbi:archaellin/type IV pilin N-terminal domain-containing protein, partial [Methanoculleus sp.]
MFTSRSSDTSGLSDAGFTGLEAAIVLIAFVVVASVFAFVVLQAGFFSAQQGQSVVHQGVGQAGSSCMVTGNVYGISKSHNYIESIIIPVRLTAGGEPIDMTTVSVRIVGPRHKGLLTQSEPLVTRAPKSGFWSIQEQLNSDCDLLLEAGEECFLNIAPQTLTDCAPYGSFVVEIKPAG